MAKAIIVEDHQFEHAVKVARITGRNRARDVALLHVLFGTALKPTELALLRIDDYLQENGAVRQEWKIREEIAYNQRERPLFWVNRKLVASVDAYLEFRIKTGLGVQVRTSYRGLQPDSALFLTEDGGSLAMTKRKSAQGDGRVLYSCDVLSQIFRRLFAQAGIEGASATSGRRSFAVKLHRRHQNGQAGGGDLREYVGQSTNVFGRLGQHASNKSMWFTKVGILAVPREQLNEVEGALIRAHNPPMNRNAPAEVTDEWREAERLATPEPGASKATAKRWPRTMAQRYKRKG